jgi:hypothetical protein
LSTATSDNSLTFFRKLSLFFTAFHSSSIRQKASS